VYWSVPGKDMHDGIVCIESDSYIIAMTAVVQGLDQGKKLLHILVDHIDFLKTQGVVC
jgi:hypothetical protein